MQVFTRGETQSLLIDREITLTVLAIYPDYVRIGINTPGEVPSYREADLYLPGHAETESPELEATIHQ